MAGMILMLRGTCRGLSRIQGSTLVCRGRVNHVTRALLIWVSVMPLCLGNAIGQTAPDTSKAEGHYFLVVDHSGSMLTPIRSGPEEGRTRWDLMRERAAAFIGRLPEGSSAWVGIFSALDRAAYEKIAGIEPVPLDGWLDPFSADTSDPEQRAQLIAQIRNFPEPAVANGTWLYQATATALDRVENVGARDPDAYMTVLIYTDGVDEGHGVRPKEIVKNPASPICRAVLEARVRQLKERHRNLNIINIYSPGDESIHDAHVVRLHANRMRLPSPAVEPEQTIQVGLHFRDDETIRLEDRPLTLKWEIEPGDEPPPLRIEGGPFRMKNGQFAVDLIATGDWPVGRDVNARLKIVYPEIDDVFIVDEGGSTINLLFQGARAPTISDLIPKDGSTFLVGRQIGFSLTTLPGCDVDWMFDDGATMRGNPVTHEFDAPGERSVTVTVTDPRSSLTGTAVSNFNITELEVSLDPIPTDVVAGSEITLTASALGEFRSFEWLIGGRSYLGTARPDGTLGSSLSLTFDRPGEIPIQVFGRGIIGGIAESTSEMLQVNAVPRLRVPSPIEGESLYFETRREFRAEIEGVEADQIRFVLSADGEELFSRDVDVSTEGPVRLAVFPFDVPTLPLKSEARLVVTALGAEPAMSREIDLFLESEPASIIIMMPEGREPHINRETPVHLESNSAIGDIRWNFGEGWTDGTAVMRHSWSSYGTYQLQAMATGPDGSELVATPVDVSIPVRRVQAAGKLLYMDGMVGRDVAKVPRRSTLQLIDESSGDAVDRRWRVNGSDLPPGQSTLVVENRGAYEVELIVIGTPEAGEDHLLISFQTNDRLLFWIYTIALLLATALLARFLLGNRWRHAEFGIQRVARTQNDPGVPDQRKFARLTGSDRAGRWSFWKKSARVSLKKMDSTVCPNWKSTDQLLFKPRGRDFSLVFAKGSPNHRLRIDPTDQMGLRDPWVRRWTIMRPLNREHDALRGAIFLRTSRNINLLRRWWPELCFLIIAGTAIYVLRNFAETLY